MRPGSAGKRAHKARLQPVRPQQERVQALVVFHDAGADHPLSRFLKAGFRHCFVALKLGAYWVTVDGRRGAPVLEVLAPSTFDLATHYRSHGLTVVETEQRKRPIRSPLVFANCVGLVKATLCIRSLALTPFQLYRHLIKERSR